MGPWITALAFVAYGLAYFAFAFRSPPSVLESFFRVPSIFVFLPPASRAKVGRIAVGALLILAPMLVAYRIASYTP